MKESNNSNPSAEATKHQAKVIKDFFTTHGFEGAIRDLGEMNRAYLEDTYRRKNDVRKQVARDNANKSFFVEELTLLLFTLKETSALLSDTIKV